MQEGNTRSMPLMDVTYQIFKLLDQWRITLICQHIVGSLNVHADWLSRAEIISTEWSLHPKILQALWQVWDRPHIDLFMTKWNHQLPCNVSTVPDRESVAVDAMSINWTVLSAYAFPPMSILGRVPAKIADEECQVILTTPFWPKQHWFPLLGICYWTIQSFFL